MQYAVNVMFIVVYDIDGLLLYTQMYKWLPEVNKQGGVTIGGVAAPKLQGGVAIGGVAVEAEFVHCYKYSVVDLPIILCIRKSVTLFHPIYPPLFAFQPEHSFEVSCLLTLLV